jgi:methyltransferase (TIGR00027 family)
VSADVSAGRRSLPAVSRTALWTAAARARESARPDRLFEDPSAAALAGPQGRELLRRFHTAHAPPDGNPFLPIRTRWFDDFLRDRPAAQVVGLGAGLDCRAYRMAWPPGTVLYEVDRPELLAYKDERLAAGPRPRCVRRTVPTDLAGNWVEPLLAAGYDPATPSVWFAEGLLFYLPEPLAGRTLRAAARQSAPGSRIAFDLIGTGVFRLRYMRPFLAELAEAGSPWRFGTDDPAGFAAAAGWRVDGVAEPGDPTAGYGRWPTAATGAGLPAVPRSFLVTASRPLIGDPDADQFRR